MHVAFLNPLDVGAIWIETMLLVIHLIFRPHELISLKQLEYL